jgi:hypothetical protein
MLIVLVGCYTKTNIYWSSTNLQAWLVKVYLITFDPLALVNSCNGIFPGGSKVKLPLDDLLEGSEGFLEFF